MKILKILAFVGLAILADKLLPPVLDAIVIVCFLGLSVITLFRPTHR